MEQIKKLYFRLSDGDDISNVAMELSGAMKMIEEQMKEIAVDEGDDIVYALTPVWLTDEEFDNLPESDM